MQTMMTTPVACHSCTRVGHCTLRSSAMHSRTNWATPARAARSPPWLLGGAFWARACATRSRRDARRDCAGVRERSPDRSSLRSPSATWLTGLAVRGVLAAPATVLAKLDPLGIVALGLVALVVTPLALCAGERDGDSDVGGHGSSLESSGKPP